MNKKIDNSHLFNSLSIPLLSRVLCLLSFLASCLTLSAKPYTPEIVDPIMEQWRWVKFPELEGKGVRCIVEDQLGQVWFGIDEGIMSYDGINWTLHGEEEGLPSTPIQQLIAMQNGEIYAASDHGIYSYREGEWLAHFKLPEGESLEVYRMVEISDGSLLVASNYGVVQMQEGIITRVFTLEGWESTTAANFGMPEIVVIPGEFPHSGTFHISDILEDSRDNLWLSLSMGNHGHLLRFKQRDIRDGKIRDFKLFSSRNRIQFGEDQRLIETLSGEIWVVNRSTKLGTHVFDGERWRTYRMNELFGTDEYCTDILQTPDGTIWITSLGKLFTYHNGEWELYRSSEARIPTNKILLEESRDDRLWMCGFKSQAYLFDYSFERWTSYRDLNFQGESEDGTHWFIHADGQIIRQKGSEWTAYGAEDGLIESPVRVLITGKGEIWAAGSHKGVSATAVMRGDQWDRHLHPELSWGVDYRAVMEAFDGSIWFGGAVDFDETRGQIGGVLQMKYDEKGMESWIHHKYQENGLNQSNAYGIGQSRDSLIWIGGGSLFCYDGNTWKQADQPLLRDFVNVVSSTPSGLLLVGSRYYGVFIYNGEEWQMYNTQNGLMSNTVMSIHGTSMDFMIAATESDISRFDGKHWINEAFPEQMNIDFEGGFISSGQDGTIWINISPRDWKRRAFTGDRPSGKIDGPFVSYRYHMDNHPPDTRIEVYAAEVAPNGNTLITWNGEDYMSNTPSDRMSYSYRMNGGEWSAFSQDNHHTFLNLDHGMHTLEVRARDLDLNVDPTPAKIDFRVLPPFWKQPIVLFLLVCFLFIIGIFEYRVIKKNQVLAGLNQSLSAINSELQEKNHQIELQNRENISQQEQILKQTRELEESYANLSLQNREIEVQRDKLAQMVVQVEALSKSKINFFTNVSHELRTPLTLILGPAHELQDNFASLTESKRKKLYKIVERNAYRLLKLINQLLEMRRIENNQLKLAVSKGNIGLYIAEITQLFDNLAQERKVDLGFQNQSAYKKIAFDRDKIEKIVTNLISNAFKHTPAGGRITVRLTSLNGQQNGAHLRDFVRIMVQDTGTGISEERMRHIFERYYSDHADRLSSGIGLTYIKELVEVHEGRIHVQSKKGEGTTFYVDIPADLAPIREKGTGMEETTGFIMSASEISHLFSLIGPDPKQTTSGSVQPGRKNILVVENDSDLLDFLAVMLEDRYNIFRAQDGVAGLDIARNHSIDLVLSDIMMPRMDGLQMCQHLKSDLVTSHIPIILLTAKAMDEHRMKGYIQGADAYLTKPFNPKVLQTRIENLLSQRSQLKEAFARDFKLQPKHVELDSIDDALLNNIVRIMEENMDESEFNVNMMCHMVGMSHTHFIRKVKQLTGKKPIELLKSFRLNRAKNLLAQNNANIAEIAYMVGYSVPNSFSRAFKKEFHMSPKEYAEQFANGPQDHGRRAPVSKDEGQDTKAG